MLTFTYCVDGEDSFTLRASEFERHGRHVGAIADKMRLGFPLGTEDCDAVAGDKRLVSSMVCYEAETVVAGMACVRDDPYYRSGAWARLEFYTAPLISRPHSSQVGTNRHYAGLLRRADAPGFDEARITAFAECLRHRRVLEALLVCEGFSCHGGSDFSALAALVVFQEENFDGASAAIAAAAAKAGETPAWTIFSIPRVAGSWFGVSPNAVVSEHLTRGN